MTTDPEGHSPVLSTTTRARVRLARAGDWEALIHQYEATCADLAETGGSIMRTSPAGDIDAHKAQAACLRARIGALCSAAELLTCNLRVHPTPEVARMIRDQFITEQRAPEAERQFREAIAACRQSP